MVTFTKLPPGEAKGARDLQSWDHRAAERRAWRSKGRQPGKKFKKSKHRKTTPTLGRGDPCPRCAYPMLVREHAQITDEQLNKPYYYARWFWCDNPACKTTTVMPERFKVFPTQPEPEAAEEVYDDIALTVLEQTGKPPWEE